jgi:hypothetical protein
MGGGGAHPRIVVLLNKSCGRCARTLNLRHFKHDGSPRFIITKLCRDCRAAAKRRNDSTRFRKRDAVRQRMIRERKRHGCTFAGCAETRARALDFNHVDPATKVKKISSNSWLWTPNFPAELEDELLKCEVLCAVHHRMHTFDEARRSPSPTALPRKSPRLCPRARLRSYKKARRDANLAMIDAFKLRQKACAICALPVNRGNVRAFDLDHLDPRQKSSGLNELATCSAERVKLELQKTRLVCANCHRLTPSTLAR